MWNICLANEIQFCQNFGKIARGVLRDRQTVFSPSARSKFRVGKGTDDVLESPLNPPWL